MNEFEVVGVEDGSYTSKKDGSVHRGVRLHFKSMQMCREKEGAEVHAEGYPVESEWISMDTVKEVGFIPNIGDKIKVFYNRYGTVGHYMPV